MCGIRWLAFGAALLTAGCSWIPFIGGDDAPHLTNAAVQACKQKAEALGYDGVAEHASTPGKDGRYSVVLAVLQDQGYDQVTCAYDPAKGAEMAPPKAAQK